MDGKIAPKPSSPLRRSVAKATALSMAEVRLFFGKKGSTARKTLSTAPKTTWLSVFGQRRMLLGGTTKSSSMSTLRGFLARGFSAIMTMSGTSVSRAQNEQRHRLNGNHSGACMISTGMTGTASHGTMP